MRWTSSGLFAVPQTRGGGGLRVRQFRPLAKVIIEHAWFLPSISRTLAKTPKVTVPR